MRFTYAEYRAAMKEAAASKGFYTENGVWMPITFSKINDRWSAYIKMINVIVVDIQTGKVFLKDYIEKEIPNHSLPTIMPIKDEDDCNAVIRLCADELGVIPDSIERLTTANSNTLINKYFSFRDQAVLDTCKGIKYITYVARVNLSDQKRKHVEYIRGVINRYGFRDGFYDPEEAKRLLGDSSNSLDYYLKTQGTFVENTDADFIVTNKTPNFIEGGFYGADTGIWNSIIMFKNDKKVYRHRVEVLIIDSSDRVYLHITDKEKNTYRIPGGSTERYKSPEEQGISECREEARINIKNIINSNQVYREDSKPPKWLEKEKQPMVYTGKYTEVYVAEFDSIDSRFVDINDRDPEMTTKGKFYPINEVWPILRKEHQDAIRYFYITNKRRIPTSMSHIFTEATLTYQERKNMEETSFGIPELRKYPLIDKKHVLSAISYFNKADYQYRKELALNIFKAMDRFGVTEESIGEQNPLRRYLKYKK